MTTAMTDLAEMLRQLDVRVRPESYVFAHVAADAEIVALADAVFREDEGTTVVMTARLAAPSECSAACAAPDNLCSR